MRRALGILADAKGVSVGEVLIALGVIMVGLMALAWVIPIPTSHITSSNRKTTAVFLAQEHLERIKNAEWKTTPSADCIGTSASETQAPVTASWTGCLGAAPPGLVTFPDEGYTAISGYAFHRRTVRITDCGVAPGCGAPAVQNANIRQVVVSVFFRPMTGEGIFSTDTEDGVQVATFIAKR